MDVFFTEIVLSLVSFAFNRTHGSTPFKFMILYFINRGQIREPSEGVLSLFTGQSVPRISHPEKSDAFGPPGPSESWGVSPGCQPRTQPETASALLKTASVKPKSRFEPRNARLGNFHESLQCVNKVRKEVL